MAHPGETLEDPVIRKSTVYLRTAQSSAGTAYDTDVLYLPHAREASVRHYHRSFDEKFEVLSGVATWAANGVEREARAGETIVIPRGTVHLNPWNATGENLRLRHYFELDHPDFALLEANEDILETLIGLAREGKVRPNGTPRNLLQLAVMLRAVQPHSYAAGAPEFLQRFVFGILSRLGHAAGYRIRYDRYAGASRCVRP